MNAEQIVFRDAVEAVHLAQYDRPRYVQGEHFYLSTGCFHGVHEHCRSTRSVAGEYKEPATCKFCPARCICPCHFPAPESPLAAVTGE